MLGSDICAILGNQSEIVPFDLKDFDVTDLESGRNIISQAKPDLLLHCAAYTDVDGAEREPERAFETNATGTKNMALVAKDLSIPMLYISTDYIFDGEKGSPYVESDKPAPLNVYGESKLAGESWVTRLLSRYFIVRTSWLFGRRGRSFIRKIIDASAAAQSSGSAQLPVVADQFGSPTYTVDLARGLATLIRSQSWGVYHVTNAGHCSWFQYAEKVFGLLRIEVKLVPVDSAQFPQAAKRPEFAVLDNAAWQKNFGARLRPWQDALEEFLLR